MLEFIFELIGEFLLQIVFEALAEVGLRSLVEPFRRPPNPWLAAFGYALLGAAAGGLSLVAFPAHLVTSHGLRIANLIITPIAVGLLMGVMGAWRARRGEQLLRIDRFACGYLFAVCLALVRFAFAH
jgi:hypothetical protein